MTTNSHPANGLVSLDRLYQIREILSKAAKQSDGGNLGYAMADAVKVINGVIASFGAEPVAWIVHARAGDQLTNDGNYVANAEGMGGIHSTPLYTAPPAPVVPEEKRDEDGNTTSEFDHGWNACRAAMLQAGNSPTIPDGYVLVPNRLTAENGAKGVLSGEFSETKFINCPECFGEDECETCDGSGRLEITVPVTWTTIKAIWAKGVEHFEAATQQENV
ncbi:hypothetical protein [Citrobacter freundii]|uniref:hypothetical protein n=1 Tax=Citrobacter freundii TaxID=546 RepID=UPI0003313FCD|nr:hypothetical protein [Citrobacter freundii]EOD58144.1 hypothetical protein H922_20062 [Citrobacter freundii GTC 09629]MDE9603486.1 hypothetical protein [Citrobacter freundii]MDT7310294.1 hypothetical protein [Citrobacter freundii]MDX7141626.1 hypothetical protein [Citrobacter freundii]HBC2888690.1 hypothetical protein [Citrobacter freundii]